MAYIFKQKFDISELISNPGFSGVILVAEPSSSLLGIYERHFAEKKMQIHACSNLDAIHPAIKEKQPFLAVLSLDFFSKQPEEAEDFLLNLRTNFPRLKIMTLGFDASHTTLKKIMSVGVCGHLDKRLSRPEDVVVLACQILNI